MNQSENQWRSLASRIAFRLRLASILGTCGLACVFAGLVLFGLGIAGRMNDWGWVWTLPVIAPAIFGFTVAWMLSTALRSKKSSIQTGFARLDHTLGLHSALSSAAAGRGKWPALPANSDDLLRFNWMRILPPWLLCVLLTVAGLLIPLPAESIAAGKIPPPRSHEEIAALISELQGVEAFRKDDLDQLQHQLDEIRKQPPENWYRHSSLEAVDHLQTGLQEQLRAMESELNNAASSLATLEAVDESMTSAEKQRLAGEFKAALQGLKNASPGLNQNLMGALSGIDPADLKSLSSGELKQMLEQMKAAANACRNCQGGDRGGMNGGNGEAQSELNDLLGSGEVPGPGQQEGPGRGGIQRGPGVAALPLRRNPTNLATDKPEILQTEDFSRARPGDAIGATDTEHELDKSPVGPRTGGAATAGKGGEAVSRDTLVPSEKAILRSYFR